MYMAPMQPIARGPAGGPGRRPGDEQDTRYGDHDDAADDSGDGSVGVGAQEDDARRVGAREERDEEGEEREK